MDGLARHGVGALGLTVTDFLTALQSGTLPQDLVWVKLQTPLGQSIIYPLAAVQDPTTQAMLDALGITFEVGIGTAAPPVTGPSLFQNLGVIVLGGLLVALLVGGRRKG